VTAASLGLSNGINHGLGRPPSGGRILDNLRGPERMIEDPQTARPPGASRGARRKAKRCS